MGGAAAPGCACPPPSTPLPRPSPSPGPHPSPASAPCHPAPRPAPAAAPPAPPCSCSRPAQTVRGHRSASAVTQLVLEHQIPVHACCPTDMPQAGTHWVHATGRHHPAHMPCRAHRLRGPAGAPTHRMSKKLASCTSLLLACLRRYLPTLKCAVGWPSLRGRPGAGGWVRGREQVGWWRSRPASPAPRPAEHHACKPLGCQRTHAPPLLSCSTPLPPAPVRSPGNNPSGTSGTGAQAYTSRHTDACLRKGTRAPVEVAHELVAEEGLAARWEPHQDDNQPLPVHALALPSLPQLHGGGRSGGRLGLGVV